MTGLVFVDALQMSGWQWGALLIAMAAIFRIPTWQGLALAHAIMLTAFRNVALLIDTRLLFQSAAYLRTFTWTQFLTEFAFRDYVRFQPPFYTFWVAQCPFLFVHQLWQGVLAFGAGGLALLVFGAQARYLLATPVYLLMSTQPGNDFAVFVAFLIVLRLIQLRRVGWAAAVYGACFLIKPLIVLTVPFFAWRLRWWALLSGGIVAGYYAWSRHYYFGSVQWGFLGQQLLLERFLRLCSGVGAT